MLIQEDALVLVGVAFGVLGFLLLASGFRKAGWL